MRDEHFFYHFHNCLIDTRYKRTIGLLHSIECLLTTVLFASTKVCSGSLIFANIEMKTKLPILYQSYLKKKNRKTINLLIKDFVFKI